MLFRRLLPCLILLHCAFSASCQATKVCLEGSQAKKVVDSLSMLPQVRREANEWRASSQYYHAKADSLGTEITHRVAAQADTQSRYDLQGVLLTSREADIANWKQKARRRGAAEWLLAALSAAIGYLAITH